VTDLFEKIIRNGLVLLRQIRRAYSATGRITGNIICKEKMHWKRKRCLTFLINS